MLKMFFIVISIIISNTAQAQDKPVKYEGFCHNGIIAARPAGTQGPRRILSLMVRGTETIACTKNDKIAIDGATSVTETPHEGLKFYAVVSITRKKGVPDVLVVSTFQEKPFRRSVPDRSI